MHTQIIQHPHGEQTMHNFIAYDDQYGEKLPAIIIAPDWSGLNDFAKNKAKEMAELGMVGIALDVYGDNRTGSNNDEKTALITPFMENRQLLRERMQAGLEFAKSLEQVDSSKIIAIGFCFGGLCVLDLARSGSDLNGVVSFHGLLNPAEDLGNEQIKAKVLALHGHEDPMVTPEQVLAFQTEMTDAGADWQVHVYGNTLHAFTNPLANDPDFGTVYSPVAEERSWQSFIDFVNQAFA